MTQRSKVRRPGGARRDARSGPLAGSGGRALAAGVQRQNHWLSFIICVSLALAVWAVFGQTLHNEFVNWDDNIYVYENPVILRGLKWSGVVWAFTHFNNSEWWPLTTISHMLDCQVYGLNAGGHHFTNVLLHAATASFLFLVLRNLTGAVWRSVFVAAVFALHPLRVESVAWVTERKDVLSGLFFVLTIGAYVRYVRQPFKLQRYLLVLALFTLGLLSKAMVVTLPFVLLLLDYWPLERWRSGLQTASGPKPPQISTPLSSPTFQRLIIEKIPLLLLAAAGSVATFLATRNNGSVLAVQGLTFPYRISNALVAYVDYLRHLLYPVGLAVGYPNPRSHVTVWTVGWSVLVLLIISAGVVAGRRKSPYLLVGWLWYLGMLVPVIDSMQAGDQARADRYTYLPQIGLCILVAWGAVELCGAWRYKGVALGVAAAVILASLVVAAQVQTAYWKDSVSLWTHCLAVTKNNYFAHNNLGAALYNKDRIDEAISEHLEAIRLVPNEAGAHVNLGADLYKKGRLDEAIAQWQEAVRLKPGYALAHYDLGSALYQKGRLDEAILQLQEAIRLQPDYLKAHDNLGAALYRDGQIDRAIIEFQEAIRLKPDSASPHYNLGMALAQRGQIKEAIPQLQEALRLRPDYTEARKLINSLETKYPTSGR